MSTYTLRLIPMLLVLMLLFVVPSFADNAKSFYKHSAAASHHPALYLKINQFYVLYTQPIGPYLNADDELVAPLKQLVQLLGLNVKYSADGNSFTVRGNKRFVTYTVGSSRGYSNSDPAIGDNIPEDTGPGEAPKRYGKTGDILVSVISLVLPLELPYSLDPKSHVFQIYDSAALPDDDDHLHTAVTKVYPDSELYPVGFRFTIKRAAPKAKPVPYAFLSYFLTVDIYNHDSQSRMNTSQLIAHYADGLNQSNVTIMGGDPGTPKVMTIHPKQIYRDHEYLSIPMPTSGISFVLFVSASR